MRHSDKSTNHKPPSQRSRDVSFERTAVGSTTIALTIIVVVAIAVTGIILIDRPKAIITLSSKPTTTTTTDRVTFSHITTQDQSCISSQGKQVRWNAAVSAILSGQVTCVSQSHHLDVTLSFRNGTIWVTLEPAIDDVFHVVSQCGSACANMTTVTE